MEKEIVIEKFLRIIENIVKQRHTKGYGASHPHRVVHPKPGLGKSEYEPEDLPDPPAKQKIKVSKYFLEKDEEDEQ